jgi:hypothetical protein
MRWEYRVELACKSGFRRCSCFGSIVAFARVSVFPVWYLISLLFRSGLRVGCGHVFQRLCIDSGFVQIGQAYLHDMLQKEDESGPTVDEPVLKT